MQNSLGNTDIGGLSPARVLIILSYCLRYPALCFPPLPRPPRKPSENVQEFSDGVPKAPDRYAKPTPKRPSKTRRGQWTCVAVACCREDIPGNCPVEPKQKCKQGTWTDKDRNEAENKAERLAKTRAACQVRHPSITCWHPSEPIWHRGG